MLAVAQAHVRSRASAEEVVQEAWVGVIRGLDRFEGRSSLKTWILRIVVNTAKTRGVREARTVPFASLPPRATSPPSSRTASAGPTTLHRRLEGLPRQLAPLPRRRSPSARLCEVVRDRSLRCRPRSAP